VFLLRWMSPVKQGHAFCAFIYGVLSKPFCFTFLALTVGGIRGVAYDFFLYSFPNEIASRGQGLAASRLARRGLLVSRDMGNMVSLIESMS